MNEKYIKKFSVGLNLNEKIEALELFFEEFAPYLSSVYFSVPLGNRYYSREILAKEYTDENKFLQAVELIKKYEIRTELTVNTYNLRTEDLEKIRLYLDMHNIVPDEIVCLSNYAEYFATFFPNTEIKYSFNNAQTVQGIDKEELKFFNTVVVGKEYLRSENKRHDLIKKGKNVVLLLNNGCSFECRMGCGTTAYCNAILRNNLKKGDINYYYALQSFFPEELENLMCTDHYGNTYRFKISNRPLGLDYTKKVLNAYMTWNHQRTIQEINSDHGIYEYFCTMGVLLKMSNSLDIKEINRLKLKLLTKDTLDVE